MTQLVFSHVTKAGVETLDRYLADAGMKRTAGAKGDVTGQSMEMAFALDLIEGTLTLDVKRLPGHMPPAHIEYAVRKMLTSGKPFGIAGRTAEMHGHRWTWG